MSQPMLSRVEMSELLWRVVEDEIRRLEEVGMLAWIRLRTAPKATRRLDSTGRSGELFNQATGNALVREASTSLQSSVSASSAIGD